MECEIELSFIEQQRLEQVTTRDRTELVLCTAGQAGSAWHQLGDDGEGSTGVHTRSERSIVAPYKTTKYRIISMHCVLTNQSMLGQQKSHVCNGVMVCQILVDCFIILY